MKFTLAFLFFSFSFLSFSQQPYSINKIGESEIFKLRFNSKFSEDRFSYNGNSFYFKKEFIRDKKNRYNQFSLLKFNPEMNLVEKKNLDITLGNKELLSFEFMVLGKGELHLFFSYTNRKEKKGSTQLFVQTVNLETLSLKGNLQTLFDYKYPEDSKKWKTKNNIDITHSISPDSSKFLITFNDRLKTNDRNIFFSVFTNGSCLKLLSSFEKTLQRVKFENTT